MSREGGLCRDREQTEGIKKWAKAHPKKNWIWDGRHVTHMRACAHTHSQTHTVEQLCLVTLVSV